MVDKLTSIFEDKYTYTHPEENGGQPFVTPYQLAFDFNDRYPDDVKKLGYENKIGGKGSGQRYSLPQYIAKNLSTNIKAGRITHIEFAFIHTNRMKVMQFKYNDEDVEASAPNTKYDISMYRLKFSSD